MRLPGATQIPANARLWPYRTNAPAKWVLHSIECSPYVDPTNIARTHKNPPHFWVCLPRRIIVQTIDTDLSARALKGASGFETNHAQARQVEIAGYARETHTYPDDWWTWLRDALLIPVAEHDSINMRLFPTAPWTGSDLAYGENARRRMSARTWIAYNGVCAHQDVPGQSHWDIGIAKRHLLVPPTPPAPPAPDPEELTVADIAIIIAKLDKIDQELDANRAATTQVGVDVQEVGEAAAGAGALVKREGRYVMVLGNKRRDVGAVGDPAARDRAALLKRALGTERKSTDLDAADLGDEIWADVEALTDEV